MNGTAEKHSVKILIVEDDYISRNLLKKMLPALGCAVLEAENGQKAWDIIREASPNLIITDWLMPEMDGLELCRKIRAASFPFYIYIIMLTARDRKKDLVDVFESGADDYIPKPFDPEELRARVMTGLRIVELEVAHKDLRSVLVESRNRLRVVFDAQLEAKNRVLENTLKRLEETRAQMLHSEKMASIGQLAAGVAHEINNPAGFVGSNLKTLEDYHKELAGLFTKFQNLFGQLAAPEMQGVLPAPIAAQIDGVKSTQAQIGLDCLMDDIPDLIRDCREGVDRIRKLVSDLQEFAHAGECLVQSTDVNKGLESTLNVVGNELKYKAVVHCDFGSIPTVRGYPTQLNQVFLNILVNAAQAIDKKGEVHIQTRVRGGMVEVMIRDTGCGIPPENIPRIFDPFFTTKDVGKGTGLGMNIAYNIVKKHQGRIEVRSQVGKGTTFTVRIPAESEPCPLGEVPG